MNKQTMNEKIGKQLRLYAFNEKIIRIDGYRVIAIGAFIFALGIMTGLVIAGLIYGGTI